MTKEERLRALLRAIDLLSNLPFKDVADAIQLIAMVGTDITQETDEVNLAPEPGRSSSEEVLGA